jgi:chondroitin 4-sulfotransferase 11
LVLVSDSHKMVFVHIQKTGGNTVHRLLEERIPDIHTIGPRHEFAIRGRQKMEAWEEYFKFAFVRNPWDRLVSWYTMVTRFQKAGNELWWYVHENSSTFEEFIYNCTDEIEVKEGVCYSFTYNQLDYVTDENGKLLVDFIGRLENFYEDVHEVFDKIGIPLESIPHTNRSEHRHYSEFYTPETEMVVRERFKRDIEYFGYEFERLRPDRGAEPPEKTPAVPRQDEPRKGAVNRRSKNTEAGVWTGRTRKDGIPQRPGRLFVCGCDAIGTTALANYLNRHPEILIPQESPRRPQKGDISLNFPTFEGILDLPLPKNLASDDHGKRLAAHRTASLTNKDLTKLRWIGLHDPDYARHLESIAGRNPGARFMVVYRSIEEVARSQQKDADDGFEQAVKAWNRTLQRVRRFIRDSLMPRVLLISYNDFRYRPEAVVPLISRFLALEFDELPVAEETLRPGKESLEKALGEEGKASIQKHANRVAEAWILDRIDKQWEEPSLYAQETSKAALAAYLDASEAKTWLLQQQVKQLERDTEGARQSSDQLQSSRTHKLVNKLIDIRSRIGDRRQPHKRPEHDA